MSSPPSKQPPDLNNLLSNAISSALSSANGWKSDREKRDYLSKLYDDDNLPPLFATTPEELEQSGMAEAFSSLFYEDETPQRIVQKLKQKGNDAFQNGKRNQMKNVQYYRDAVNCYYEALEWAEKVEVGAVKEEEEGEGGVYSEEELKEMKSTICANAAMAHMQLKNWGFVREYAAKALEYNPHNIKATYRLAKAHQNLHEYESAHDAIQNGLSIDPQNNELHRLQTLIKQTIRKTTLERQTREKARARRLDAIQEVWNHCTDHGIRLGRIPLVSGEDDDEEENGRWQFHHPHSGTLPQTSSEGEWTWPCMFLYPSHNQSDYIPQFGESEMMALRMAQLFPESDDGLETSVSWDTENVFVCSQLAIYFEVHSFREDTSSSSLHHPDAVERLTDLKSTMRYYEIGRALKGDEGDEMAKVARLVERKHFREKKKMWVEKYGSLWCRRPDSSCPVVRVHPAVTLKEVLVDERMVVPNFLVTFLLFPLEHPAHEQFLKEHQCLGIIQPKNDDSTP